MFHSMHHSSGSFWSKFIAAFFGVGMGLMPYAIGQDQFCCDPDAAWFDGFVICLQIQGYIEDADGVICDVDCGPVDGCLCGNLAVEGCMDSAAQNFNSDATRPQTPLETLRLTCNLSPCWTAQKTLVTRATQMPIARTAVGRAAQTPTGTRSPVNVCLIFCPLAATLTRTAMAVWEPPICSIS